MHPEVPDFRLTRRRDGHLRVIDWGPWLTTSGPLNTLLDARGRAGVLIADLTVLRADDGTALELIVHVRCGDPREHRDALLTWAQTVGYRRVWLGDEVIELGPTPGGRAATKCTGCRARLVDSGTAFWSFVRAQGAFPSTCTLCGGDLPQWTAESANVRSYPRPATIHR